VADLTVTSGYPCISVLLPTQPAPWMTPGDFERLHQLIATVDHTLREQGVISSDRLIANLSDEARRVATQPTDRALAIYVNLDRMLGDYRTEHPSPLVLAGTPQLLDRFCALSRNLERLAGRARPNREHTALDLAMACTETIEHYLRGRREDAMGQLTQALRVRSADVSAGIEDCWRAVQSRAPAMMLVEENFISPGLRVTGASRQNTPPSTENVHDLVDDLIEQVILHGGQLALVRDGDLEPHARVALISRARRG